KPNSQVNLNTIDPNFIDEKESYEHALPEIEAYNQKLNQLQYLMYAENQRSLLICLQGRDAAGKDGTISHVLGAMNPRGCSVNHFCTPSNEESAHNFLWRYEKVTPAKGEVAIFNRTHYEDVLFPRVHHLVPEKVWSKRYRHINAFEERLYDNGTHILKFYLHIDEDEQLKRFEQRLVDPSRHWKISEWDYIERNHWDDYTLAYEVLLSKCSTDYAPWFIIPANHKWFRNLAISKIITEYLGSLKMEFPEPGIDLVEIAKKYHSS
ncbi:MAG: PPK2 family polyphosphate kinase, partial [Cyanobacteria bacterium P01_H01_bin.15]